jgi:thiazole synthase
MERVLVVRMTPISHFDDDSSDGGPWLVVNNYNLRSRLIVGIEQYNSPEVVRDVFIGSNSELLIVTVDKRKVRRGLPLTALLDYLKDLSPVLVGTTCYAGSSDEAVLTARLLRDSLGVDLIKLDVRPDKDRSLPDNTATIKAAQVLTKEGFNIIPMIIPEPAAALELQRIGCCALRLLAGPVRSGLGVTNLQIMMAVKDAVSIPCIGEGGIATVADAAIIIQNGFDAVLVNSAITKAAEPGLMAKAMRHAVAAGRLCYLAGMHPEQETAALNGDSECRN